MSAVKTRSPLRATSKDWREQLKGDFLREGAKIICIKNGRRDVVADFSEFGYDGECWARSVIADIGGM